MPYIHVKFQVRCTQNGKSEKWTIAVSYVGWNVLFRRSGLAGFSQPNRLTKLSAARRPAASTFRRHPCITEDLFPWLRYQKIPQVAQRNGFAGKQSPHRASVEIGQSRAAHNRPMSLIASKEYAKMRLSSGSLRIVSPVRQPVAACSLGGSAILFLDSDALSMRLSVYLSNIPREERAGISRICGMKSIHLLNAPYRSMGQGSQSPGEDTNS